ncbi:unnamed protein product [Darwinula stevensoni]|uniref:Uncharacterized protein n=1 Tax=Darwinula stevensoni TaxID=69355 RepID=A0A7R8XIC0_9CRUS|nr:unnamed protein product [Darwinula stevensoni]CAG0891133.1 unnamed protein product [Darwinula stevensoni]
MRMADTAVQKVGKPQLRGLLQSYIKRHIMIGGVLAFASLAAWKVLVADDRKRKYDDFYENYDAEKDFERIRKLGHFRGALSRRGVPLTSSNRLPSFRPPRDLTLTPKVFSVSPGTKPKRVFTPNLPSRRDRSRPAEEPSRTPRERPGDRDGGRGRRGGTRGRGDGARGKGRGKPELIQTTGSVFGEGIAASGESVARRVNIKVEKDSPVPLMKSKLNLSDVKDLDKAEEDMMLRELLRDDFVDDPSATPDDKDVPVYLPMGQTVHVSQNGKTERDSGLLVFVARKNSGCLFKEESIKNERHPPVIKRERLEEEAEEEDVKGKKPLISSIEEPKAAEPALKRHSPELPPETSLLDLIQNPPSDFLFLQLPDSLPGLSLLSKEHRVKQAPGLTPGAKNETPGTSKEAMEDTEMRCTLKDLPEGQLGVLKVRKSGKADLVLQGHILHVEMGTQVGFLQDLAAVTLSEDEKSGDMNTLSRVRHRLVLAPDWESLLQSKDQAMDTSNR